MTNFSAGDAWGNCFCTKCDILLDDFRGNTVGPCPKCGGRAHAKRAAARSEPTVEAGAKAQALYDRTQRAFSGHERDDMVDHRDWSIGTAREEILADPLAERFLASLESVPVIADTLRCFRGVTHVQAGARATRGDCGPPPAAKVTAGGRYHVAGEPVLYLSDSDDGVAAELAGRAAPWWVQGYELPPTLRLADFSQLPTEHPANQAFWFAEIANRDGHAPSGYLFGQVLAELVRTRFPNGMRVLGTRESSAPPYSNVVLFTFSSWESWLVGEPVLRES